MDQTNVNVIQVVVKSCTMFNEFRLVICNIFSVVSYIKLRLKYFFYRKPLPVPIHESYLELSKNDKFDSFTIVKFRSISYFPYMLKRQFTETDFIAYTGGAFGLFLGISIMSFVEVFYYFTIRLLFAYVRNKRKNKKVRGELIEVLDKTKSKLSYVKFYFSISTVHGMIQIIMDHRNFIERYVDGI